MKSVCVTSPDNPAMSTVKSICYPHERKFQNAATSFGCQHEEDARNAFLSKKRKDHTNLTLDQCGFFICPHHPHIGASPDGIILCDCCGKGCLEVKCPYCLRSEVTTAKASCLEETVDGKLQLKRQD